MVKIAPKVILKPETPFEKWRNWNKWELLEFRYYLNLKCMKSIPALEGLAFKILLFFVVIRNFWQDILNICLKIFVISWQLRKKQSCSDAKVLGLAMLEGLQATEHSLARSHYWPPRGLLAAGCGPWPGSPLVRQPEPLRLLGGAHVDASLSADAGSTWPDDQQGSLPQAIPSTCLLVAGLQEHATTPGDK